MNYTLHQLRVFLKISEYQSITKAAEELSLTQPAVSIQLKKFQDQFPIPLTEIIGRQLYITDFGKEIRKAAEKILSEVDNIGYRTLEYKNLLAGKLKVSVASTGKYVMPYFLSGFMRMNRGVDLIMDVTNKTYVIQSMENNEVDFSLVSIIPDAFKTYREELLPNKLFLIGSSRIPIAANQSKRRIFEEYPLIYREPGSATRASMEAFIRSKNLSTYKKIELTSNEALKQAVLAGLGFSIMPLIGIKNELRNGDLQIIPFKGLPIITQWNLIWLQSKELTPVSRAFLDYIRQNKLRIAKEDFSWFDKY